MKKTTFSISLITAFFLGALSFFVISDKKTEETELKTKVDIVYKDRIVERVVYKQKIDSIKSFSNKKIERLETAFKAGKIDSMFNEEIPSTDTTSKLIPVSERQLQACVETKYKHERDSLELLITKENLDNCDSELDSVIGIVDSSSFDSSVKDKKISFWKKVAIISSAIAATLFTIGTIR